MIHRIVIIVLVLLAGVTLTAWVAGHWTVISWRSKDDCQTPFVSLHVSNGWCSLYHYRDTNDAPGVKKFWLLAGYAFRIQAYGDNGVAVLDEPAGFSLRNDISPWDEDGNWRWGDLSLVELYHVTETEVVVPFWPFLILFGAYPAIAFVRGPLRRWRRRRRGCCIKCGYNLTGNVSGRCPECGEAI